MEQSQKMQISLRICQFGQVVVLLAALVSIINSALVYRVANVQLDEVVDVTKSITNYTEQFKDGRVKTGTTTTEKNNVNVPVSLTSTLLIASTITAALITLAKALFAYGLLTIAIVHIHSLNAIPTSSHSLNQGRSGKSNVRASVYDEHLPSDT